MIRFCDGIPEDVEQAIATFAEELHSGWLTCTSYFGDDSGWLQAMLASRPQLSSVVNADVCLRFHLIAIEMRLSEADRDRLRGIASEVRDRFKSLPWSDQGFYRELDDMIIAGFGGVPITFFRLRQLSLQLTNCLVGFGDTQP